MSRDGPVRTTTITLSVDRVRCCGYGLCVTECPEVYELDDDGLSRVKVAVVPPELREAAELGAYSCPEAAIVVNETACDPRSDDVGDR